MSKPEQKTTRRSLLKTIGITGAFAASGGLLYGLTNESGASNNVHDKIGDLQHLITSDQSSLVGALNEQSIKLAEHNEQLDVLHDAIGDPVEAFRMEGETDDTAVVNRALSHVSSKGGGKLVFSPNRVYRCAECDVPANVMLYGAASTVIKLPDLRNTYIFKFTGERSVLTGVTIDGNKEEQNGNHALIQAAAPKIKIVQVTFRNAYDKIMILEPSAAWSQIMNCVMDGNGILGNCNAITCKSSNVLICNNTFLNHGNGHSIRTGYFEGEDPVNVRNILIQGNIFDNLQHNAITFELGSSDISVIGNLINNCPQSLKGDASAKRITVIGNRMKNIHIRTAFNLNSVTDCIVIGNELRDSGGGYTVGERSIVKGNRLINSQTGYLVKNYSYVEGNIAIGVKENPYRLVGGIIKGNIAEECQNTAGNYQFYVGEGSYPKGIVFEGNKVINPIKVNRPLEAFMIQGTDWVATGNILTEDQSNTDVGFRAFGMSADRYIIKDNIVKAATSIITPSTVGKSVIIKDNIE